MSLESITQLSKSAEKPEKSQEEIRDILKQKLFSLKPTLENGIKEYEKLLEDGSFEDQEGEVEGTGEARKIAMQNKLNAIFARAERVRSQLDSKELLPQITPELSTTYIHPDNTQETITLNIEAKIQEFTTFYQTTHIDLPTDFEQIILDIWERNQSEIQEAIEKNGFDDMLLIPSNIPLADLAEKMKMENGNYTGSNFDEGGGFAGAISFNVDKPRLVLVHRVQNLKDRPELKQTLNIKGKDVKLDQALTLEDYIIFQRKYFEENQKHLDEIGWTWLSTKSGTRLVYSAWRPDNHKLAVDALDLEDRRGNLGVRPSRSYF